MQAVCLRIRTVAVALDLNLRISRVLVMSVVAKNVLLQDTNITGQPTSLKPDFAAMFPIHVPAMATTYFSAATEAVRWNNLPLVE